METKEITIKVPEGYEIDRENSTFECIKFKPIKKELPKSWKEFCETHPRKIGESYLTASSSIETIKVFDGLSRNPAMDKNVLPSRELAEAILALCQLIQLRDCYNGGWTPDYQNNYEIKYCIIVLSGKILDTCYSQTQRVLVFKTEELCNQFLENFRYLIEIAKPLL